MNNESGISLIEILLSVVLIGFIILAINSVPNSIRLIGTTQKESLAKDIASKEIEQLRSQTYDNIANANISITDPRLSSLPSSSGIAVISDCPITVCPNNELVKQITVTISWQDQAKVNKVTMGTFIAKGGLK